MNEIKKNEQWLLDADCEKCRRSNYCNKPCTKFKKIEMEIMRDMWNTAFENAQKRVSDIKEENKEIAKD